MPINATSFRKTLTYAATASVTQIFQDLDEIAKIDKKIKSQQYLPLIVVVISGGVVYASYVLIGTNPSLGGILLLISIVGIIVGFLLLILFKYRVLNIQNYRHELIKPLLSLVSRDSKENATFNIHLVFSSPTAKNKQVSTGNHPNRRGWKVQLFQDQWCNFEGELLDGNRFQLTLSELNRIASGRNPRGKYKSKTKLKGSEIILKVNCSPRQYGAIKVLREEAREAIQLPPGVEVKGLKITDKAILLNVIVPPNSGAKSQETLYKIITMMFLSLYQILNLAKMLTKKKNA
jgi:hypothetical protein